MKSGITMLKEVVDTTTSLPVYTENRGDEYVVGYRTDRDSMRKIFAINGFNVHRDTWKVIITTWLECGLLLKLNEPEGYFIPEATLMLFNQHGKVKKLADAKSEIESTYNLYCEVLA